MSYLDELRRELDRVGVDGAQRARIVTEIEDHLSIDPDARLGTPAEIAERFADELGTRRALRSAVVSFSALALAGLLFAATFISSNGAGIRFPHLHPRSSLIGTVAVALSVLGPQVAFVCGSLAALRAFRRRGDAVLSRTDAAMISRRAIVGVGAGILAMAGIALMAAEYGDGVAGWWTTLAWSSAVVGAVALLATSPTLVAAARLRPVATGESGDLFDDLGSLTPRPLRGRPWTFALVVAGVVVIAVAAAGAAASDPFDGLGRGIADGLACLGGFAVLGRYLGLR